MQALNVGMIGLDTSHCEGLVGVLNYPDAAHHVPGARVVGACAGGSRLCAVSRDRVGRFTEAIREKHGVRLYDSIEELGEQVDAFLLTSVDGRQHLEQFRALCGFGKPVFIDKPLACSVADARAIAALAEETGTPWMSASSIRYAAGVSGLAAEDDEVGSCEAFGTMPILEDYPGYFWYGVHGADLLFSYLGRGCQPCPRAARGRHGLAGRHLGGRPDRHGARDAVHGLPLRLHGLHQARHAARLGRRGAPRPPAAGAGDRQVPAHREGRPSTPRRPWR